MPEEKLSPALARIVKRRAKRRNFSKGIIGEIEASDVHRDEAWRKLTEEHKSRTTISKEMGVSKPTVTRWLNHKHELTLTSISQRAGAVRAQQAEQYDQLIERWLPLAIHEGLEVKGTKYGKNGELEYVNIETWDAGLKAAATVAKFMEQKAKLFGLQMQVVEHKGDIKGAGNIFVLVQKLAHQIQDDSIEGEFEKVNDGTIQIRPT